MKKLIIALIIIIGLFCTYWFIAAGQVAAGAQTKIDEYRAQGYTISHAPVDVSGFPLRFDADMGPLSVTAPKGPLGQPGAKAVLQKADISAASYMPLAWTVSHDGAAQFDVPAGTARWVFDTITDKADVQVKARPTGGLAALNIDAQNVAVTDTAASAPPVKSIADLDYSFTRKAGAAAYKLNASDIKLSAAAMGQAGRALGADISQISGTMNVAGFETPAAAYSSNDLSVVWGPADMGGGFDLSKGQDGLSGTITLNIADPETLMKTLTQKGILSSGEAMIAGLMIGGLPRTDDGRSQFSLAVQDSTVRFGPIKLGKLPF